MKKKTTTAILLATTMMLALMGCGAASESSSDAKAPVAEINEKADIDSADTDKEEKDDTDIEADTETSTESATPADSTATAESAIEYKGEKFSALEDLQTSLDKAGSVAEPASGYPIEMETRNCLYAFDMINKETEEWGLHFTSFDDNGKEAIMQVSSNDPNSKTSKGIHPGSTKDELIAAYGEQKPDELGWYSYEFDNYSMYFKVENDKVTLIGSENLAK